MLIHIHIRRRAVEHKSRKEIRRSEQMLTYGIKLLPNPDPLAVYPPARDERPVLERRKLRSHAQKKPPTDLPVVVQQT